MKKGALFIDRFMKNSHIHQVNVLKKLSDYKRSQTTIFIINEFLNKYQLEINEEE